MTGKYFTRNTAATRIRATATKAITQFGNVILVFVWGFIGDVYLISAEGFIEGFIGDVYLISAEDVGGD